MFSGIVEEVGKVKSTIPISGGKKFTVGAQAVTQHLKVSDSVAVSGVCLTVVEVSAEKFSVEAVGDTLFKSTLADLKVGDSVNLERALRLNDRLGGHFVQGHVNGTGRVLRFKRLGENWDLQIRLESDLMRYVIPEGSIAVDGISLTVAEIRDNSIRISVIPHTYKSTTMLYYQRGGLVNIETDFLGKYIEKFVSHNKTVPKISESWLKDLGY